MFVKHDQVKIEDLEDGLSRKLLARGGKMMLVEVSFKKGTVGYLHSHPHEQISYIKKGSFEVEINGEKQILKEGDSFYTEPDVKHGVVALEDSVIIDVFTPQREDFL